MLQELLISVVSGLIVAIVLQIMPFGGRREAPSARSRMAPPPRSRPRGSFFGGLMRFIFSIAGGIGIAYIAAQFLRVGHSHRGFDHHDGIAAHAPMLMLTVIGTIFVWLFLSAITRR